MDSRKFDSGVRDLITLITTAIGYVIIWIALPRDLAVAFTAALFVVESWVAWLGRRQQADTAAIMYMMNMDANAVRRGMQSYFDAGRAGHDYRHDWNAADEEYQGIERAKLDLQGEGYGRVVWTLVGAVTQIALVVGMALLGMWLKPTVAPILGL